MNSPLAEEGNEFGFTAFWQATQQFNQRRGIPLALCSLSKTYSISLTTPALGGLLIFGPFAEVKLPFPFCCCHAGPVFSLLLLPSCTSSGNRVLPRRAVFTQAWE